MRSPQQIALLLIVPFSLIGCHVSGGSVTGSSSCTVNGPNAGVCTVTAGGTITFAPKVVIGSAESDDLTSIGDGTYTISVSAPANTFTADTQDSAETTISASTDQGYSSSIALALVPTAPAIQPVNTGDAVFSFNLPASAELSAWIQQVAANTTTTMQLQSSAGLPLQMAAGSGSVTFTSVLTSNAVPSYTVGTLNLNRFKAPGSTCKPGMVCTQ